MIRKKERGRDAAPIASLSSGGRDYRVIYPDEDCELKSPFGWELDMEEGIIHTVTHEGQLSDRTISATIAS